MSGQIQIVCFAIWLILLIAFIIADVICYKTYKETSVILYDLASLQVETYKLLKQIYFGEKHERDC